jgi:hypothetical protein
VEGGISSGIIKISPDLEKSLFSHFGRLFSEISAEIVKFNDF